MKRFSFRLEKLLKIKERLEKETQAAFVMSAQKVETQQAALDLVRERRSATFENERDALSGRGLRLDQLKSYSRYYATLDREELFGREILGALTREMEVRRVELQKAAQERKAIESLKEKRRDTHRYETEREDQSQTDETAATVALRQRQRIIR